MTYLFCGYIYEYVDVMCELTCCLLMWMWMAGLWGFVAVRDVRRIVLVWLGCLTSIKPLHARPLATTITS